MAKVEIVDITRVEPDSPAGIDKPKLLKVLGELALPKGEYLVFGSGCLAVRGIRRASDIDLLVDQALYIELMAKGWQQMWPREDDPPLLEHLQDNAPVHAFYEWQERYGYQPDIPALIRQPEMIEGFPFLPLDIVYEWKGIASREKDTADIGLIDQYRSAVV